MNFEIYRDKKGEWRWRLKARNGRCIADSGEGYKRRGDAIKMIRKVNNGVYLSPAPLILHQVAENRWRIV